MIPLTGQAHCRRVGRSGCVGGRQGRQGKADDTCHCCLLGGVVACAACLVHLSHGGWRCAAHQECQTTTVCTRRNPAPLRVTVEQLKKERVIINNGKKLSD